MRFHRNGDKSSIGTVIAGRCISQLDLYEVYVNHSSIDTNP